MTSARRIPLLLLALVAVAGCAKAPPLVTAPASPPSAVLFSRASVLDTESGELTANLDVLVRGDRIAAIGDAGSIEVPAGAATIDARGATLLPGLVDSHGHVANGSAPPWYGEFPDPERNLQAYLFCGVTTVIDPADLEPDAFERRADVAAGRIVGPRIHTAGPMLTAVGGHPIPVIEELAPWYLGWYVLRHATRPVDSQAAAEAAVAELADARADFVKIAVDSIPDHAPRLGLELARAVVSSAHARRLRVVAHIGSLDDAIVAGDAGVDAWMHMVYKEALDPAGASKLAAYRIPMVATMGVFESYALTGRRKREPSLLERETVAPEILAAFDELPEDAVGEPFRAYFDLLHSNRQAWRENIRLLREAGITVLAGSDAQTGVFPGAGLHRELALLVEGGMTPAQAIRAATLDAARFLSASDDPDFGSVRVGKVADLLLVDGNPTFHLSALARIRTVMKGGVMLERHPLPIRPS